MKEFIEEYRSVALFEVKEFNSSEGKKLGAKVVAKAFIPDLENMKVDFAEEAENQSQALKAMKRSIDCYLKQHDLKKLKQNNLEDIYDTGTDD